jgi:hypothetical protein
MTQPAPAAQTAAQWTALAAAYRAGQDQVNRAFAGIAVQVLSAIPRWDPSVIPVLAAAFAPMMGSSRQAGYNLVKSMYLGMRPTTLPPWPDVPATPLPFPTQAVQDSLTRILPEKTPQQRARSARLDPQTVSIQVADLVRQVEDGPRQGLINMVTQDPHAVQWARYDTGGEPCAFCLTLISRGPVYSADTVGFTAHPNDRCIGVPVFVGYRSSPMWAQAQKALDVYTSAQRNKQSGQTAINAVRVHLNAQSSHPLAETGIAPGGTA